MGKKVYNFKGVQGASDKSYSGTQLKAINKVKSFPVEVKLSNKEIKLMKDIAGLKSDIRKETILRTFITKILQDEF
ncbi:hypothetical protein OAC46_01825 [Flavobacteriaceae bacterium]|nr:hypothetical protein [Flavobacteriaceae bacterium]MDC0506811.1 hypothetical protein [Flavobacteriaceae bacterium]